MTAVLWKEALYARLAANCKDGGRQERSEGRHLEPGCLNPLACRLLGVVSATEEGFRTHQAQVAGEKWSLAGDAGARAARNLLLGVCKRPAVLHGAAPPRGFIWSGEGSPGLPPWDGTTHTP